MTAKLHNLTIEDCMQMYGKEYQYIAQSTSEKSDLVSIEYINIQRVILVGNTWE